MGSLRNINPRPRFTEHLVASQAFASRPMVVVDVGARGGTESHWRVYGDQARLIGFEADTEECARLNEQAAGSGRRFFPVGLHSDNGRKTFYVTAYPGSSGFCPPDDSFLRRFAHGDILSVVKTIEMNTVTLDSLARENDIDYVDFIKLDAEGGELDCLKGAAGFLKKTVLGVSVEVSFCQWHKDQPLFSDVDSFLRPLGFSLFELTINRHSRKALPAATPAPLSSPSPRGQVMWGQGLYLRDGANEIESYTKIESNWDDAKVLKLASLMELFSLADCAIELVQVAHRKGFLEGQDTGHLVDLLVPPVGNKALSYDEYQEHVRFLRSNRPPANGSRPRRLARRLLPSPARKIAYNGLVAVRNSINRIIS